MQSAKYVIGRQVRHNLMPRCCRSCKYEGMPIYNFANITIIQICDFVKMIQVDQSILYTMSAQGLRGLDITSQHLLCELLGEDSKITL